MAKKISVKIGDKFNRLTIIDMIKNKHNQTKLKCQCDCGKIIFSMPYNLRSNHTKSCGCLKLETTVARNTKYKIGMKIGKLTIISELDFKNNGKRVFKFQCECGKIVEKTIHYSMKSCGCLKRTCKDPIKTHYNHYKSSCKSRKIKFILKQNEFEKLILDECYYCGEMPSMKIRFTSQLRNGIDRKNNAEGYNNSNCVTCCANCNFAKRTLSINSFLSLINKIYNKHFKA